VRPRDEEVPPGGEECVGVERVVGFQHREWDVVEEGNSWESSVRGAEVVFRVSRLIWRVGSAGLGRIGGGVRRWRGGGC
jgi:hypothetical protein